MATYSALDVSNLTLNPKEAEDFGKFVFERTFEDPALNSIHNVVTGLTMKEQIVLAGLMPPTGIKDTGCERPNSGAKVPFSEAYWEPVKVGDTLIHCPADLNGLFKAYYNKVSSYRELYDIEGSDLHLFLLSRVEDSATKAIRRLAWFGDKNVDEATASLAGLKDDDNIPLFDPIDGIWQQIFTRVGTGSIQKADVGKNAFETFNNLWRKADSRLRTAEGKQILVSREIFDDYVQYLTEKSIAFTLDATLDGLPRVNWNGIPVVNMETVWDLNMEYFIKDSGGDPYLPLRAILTIPGNIPIGTLNDGDFDYVETNYDWKERQTYLAYGFTIDAKVIEDYLIVTAYDDAFASGN